MKHNGEISRHNFQFLVSSLQDSYQNTTSLNCALGVSISYMVEITYQQSGLTITLGICGNLGFPRDRVVQNLSIEALQKRYPMLDV